MAYGKNAPSCDPLRELYTRFVHQGYNVHINLLVNLSSRVIFTICTLVLQKVSYLNQSLLPLKIKQENSFGITQQVVILHSFPAIY